MLRVAVPNKGALSDPATQMLHEAGYRMRNDRRDLVVADPDHDAEFFFLRPRDIATYVGAGQLDVGITGRDLLLDSGADAEELLALGMARSAFRFAAPPGGIEHERDLAGRRIATTFVGLVRRRLDELGIHADVVHLDGAVETSVQLGVADAIADVVETGGTIRRAGLVLVGEPILESEALLIRRKGAEPDEAVGVLVRRLQGVIIARQYVMMDYDCPQQAVERACELTPGIESPTVSPLREEGWVAIRAMVPRRDSHRRMDELYALGCRGILVTEIAACRL
ncbi:MAG TPA: ATP phosphoribosyltransferase [Nitriliruptorales bacterium]